jgi:hypothetical protein
MTNFSIKRRVFLYKESRERVLERAMDANCQMLKDLIVSVQATHNPTRYYEPNEADASTTSEEHDASLSGIIEDEIELLNGSGDADNTTTWKFTNPYSDKDGIINWHSVSLVKNDPFKNRGVMLSNASALNPAGGLSLASAKEGAAGMVVGYFHESTHHIMIYWINREGEASSKQIDLDMSQYY